MARFFQPVIGPPEDLDDPKTYARFPQTIRDVQEALWRKIGYAAVYVIAHQFSESECGQKQIDRIGVLVEAVAKGQEQRGKPLIWWQEQLYLFEDEIENMC